MRSVLISAMSPSPEPTAAGDGLNQRAHVLSALTYRGFSRTLNHIPTSIFTLIWAKLLLSHSSSLACSRGRSPHPPTPTLDWKHHMRGSPGLGGHREPRLCRCVSDVCVLAVCGESDLCVKCVRDLFLCLCECECVCVGGYVFASLRVKADVCVCVCGWL